MKKKIVSLLLALSMLLCLFGCARKPDVLELTIDTESSYADRLAIGQLEYSAKREDYDPDVTDEQFANFRAVSVAGIRPGTLYRSSSPIDSLYGRNETADALARKAGIRFFVDLMDTEEQAKDHDAYADSYFSTQDSVCMAMSVAFTSDTFAASV